ncbi:MAG: hypothetical protein FJ149_07195 [Euryarchaeota archaeon]|nr:hypothetical protein [Euryarchaeota archaeon]
MTANHRQMVSLVVVGLLVATGLLAASATRTGDGGGPAPRGWVPKDTDWTQFRHDAAHSGAPVWAPSPADWTTFRGDNGRTGVSEATASMRFAYLKWMYRTGGSRVSSSPAVANVDPSDPNPELLIGSEDYRLYCLNATSGRLKWRFPTQGPVSASPAVGDIDSDGVPEVVFGSGDGRVYAVDGPSGSLLWRYTTRAPVLASPLIADINGDDELEVVVASMDGMVYALRGDGTRLWRATVVVVNDKSGEGIYASPAVADIFNDGWMKVLVSAGQGLSLLNGTDGSHEGGVDWHTVTGQSHYIATPAVKDLDGNGAPEIVSIYGDPPRFSVDQIQRSWASSDGVTDPRWVRVVSSPALCDGDGDGIQEAYFGTDSGRVICVQMERISEMGRFTISDDWSRNVTGPVRSSPALADLDGDGKMELLVGSDNRRVVCLNAEDGTPSWQYLVPKAVFSSPAVADGDLDGKAEVFFGCYDGTVYALDYNF